MQADNRHNLVNVGNLVKRVVRLSAVALKQKRRNGRECCFRYIWSCMSESSTSRISSVFLRDLNGCRTCWSSVYFRSAALLNTSVSIIDPSRSSPIVVMRILLLLFFFPLFLYFMSRFLFRSAYK